MAEMTPQEAIQFLKETIAGCHILRDRKLKAVCEVSINALEKQIPKDLKLKSNGYYGCCNCGHLISSGTNYCAVCGQATTMNCKSIKGVIQIEERSEDE